MPSAHTTNAAPANTSSLDNILAAIQSLSQRLDSLENCKSAPDKTIKRKAENKDQPLAKKQKMKAGPMSNDEPASYDERTSTAVTDLTKELLGDSEEEENKDTGEEDDIYSEFASSFAATEKKGLPIDQKLAKLLQERFGEKMDDKQLREKLLAYPIPENCPNMSVPRTNQEIFNALQPQVRRADIRLSNTQQSISKAAVAITTCADRLLTIRKRTKAAGAPPILPPHRNNSVHRKLG